MVAVLKLSRSGYYTWRQNGMVLSPRSLKHMARDVLIKASFDDSNRHNGARRI